jgi:hypothetical protein
VQGRERGGRRDRGLAACRGEGGVKGTGRTGSGGVKELGAQEALTLGFDMFEYLEFWLGCDVLVWVCANRYFASLGPPKCFGDAPTSFVHSFHPPKALYLVSQLCWVLLKKHSVSLSLCIVMGISSVIYKYIQYSHSNIILIF